MKWNEELKKEMCDQCVYFNIRCKWDPITESRISKFCPISKVDPFFRKKQEEYALRLYKLEDELKILMDLIKELISILKERSK